MSRRILTVLVAVAMCVSMFAGCGDEVVNTDITGVYGKGEITYPLQTNGEELEFFISLAGGIAKMGKTMDELEFRKGLQERTGINVKYITPSSAQWDEQFNLLFSSSDLPDIIYGNWRDYAGGGADGVIDSGFIMDLTPYLEDYAPNLWKMLQENDAANRSAKSPKGRYYSFSAFNHDVACYGPYLRADWLKELGLEVPETLGEWETVLAAFRDKKGADAPLAFGWSKFYTMGVFETAFKTSSGIYVDDNGKIVYGPATNNWKEYMLKMKEWVEKGLLDKNVVTTENDALNAYLLNGETGAAIGWLASGIGAMLNAKPNESFDLIGAPYPVMNKGDQPSRYGGVKSPISDNMAIAANSQNKELAMRFLDYGYSEEGDLYFNYGVEGVAHEIVDGKPKYTDLIMKNPDGLTISDALTMYTHASSGGPYSMHNETYLEQIVMPQQVASTKAWATDDSHMIPGMSLTSEEKTEYANIMTEIETYVGEITAGFICGQKDISEVDAMPAKLKSMGLDRALEIQQTALDRYNK